MLREQYNFREQIDLESLHEEANRYLQANKIKEENFSGIYGKSTVEADIIHVSEQKNKWEKKKNELYDYQKKLATILEFLVTRNINEGQWLGDNTEAKPTSNHDDLENHIDTITIFKRQGFEKYLGLAMDATYSEGNKEILGQKFNSLRHNAVTGKLGMLKYFETERIKGQLSQVPKVIIGIQDETVKEVAGLLARGDHEAVKNHWMQFQILEEIEHQLRTLIKYTQEQPNDTFYKKTLNLRKKTADTYREAHKIILDILKERRSQVEDSGKRDNMFNLIKEQTDRLITQDRN